MPISAWIMFVFGSLVLYGGLAVCIGIAVRSSKKNPRT
ncbi:MAG: MetS family NSS transporter small subunit [Phycisphaerae bacterium]|nr:MetS family NSS transporter small subunit [Phycisphaerae bacterium]